MAPVVPSAEGDEPLEPVPEETAVAGAERQHQAGERDAQAEAERAHVDQRALRDDHHAERDEDDRRQVGGGADRRVGEVLDRAAVEAEPEDGGEEDAEAGEAEADQLRMLVRVGERIPAALAHRPLLDAAGRLWGGLVGPLSARHEGALRVAAGQSFRT